MSNLFNFIDFNKKGDPMNKLYGIPNYINHKNWPKSIDGEYLNHFMTISIQGLHIKGLENTYALSFFFKTEIQNFDHPLKVIKVNEKNKEKTTLLDYPKAYKPWFIDDFDKASAGFSFDFKERETPNLESISRVLEGTLDMSDVIDSELDELIGEQSYIGGFPVWIQVDETPTDSNGKKCQFILAINGFHELIINSPFCYAIWYLFYEGDDKFYWIAQA